MKIMAHLVAGYPTQAVFHGACRAMAEGGIEILELQLPFSDPTADGPLNTLAGETALRNGFTMNQLDWYLSTIAGFGFEEVHIMTYANIVFRFGIRQLAEHLESFGVTGIIVPDLPMDEDEGLFMVTAGMKLDAVPVIAVNMGGTRRQLLKDLQPKRCYVSLRTGVTGRETYIGEQELRFLDDLPVPRIYAGFGITTGAQAAVLEEHVHAVVVGSYFTRLIAESGGEPDTVFSRVLDGVRRLKGSDGNR